MLNKQNIGNTKYEDTLVLDPGLRASGVSLWSGGNLIHATVVRYKSKKRDGDGWLGMADNIALYVQEHLATVSCLVYEKMLYLPEWAAAKGGHKVVDDLLQLSGLTGVVIGLLYPRHIVQYTPLQWKRRGETKEQTAHDMPLRLTESELETFRLGVAGVPTSLRHNAIDAVAIGSYHHRRKKRHRRK